MNIVLEVTVEAIKTRVDKTVSVTLGTQEIDSSQAGNLFQLRGKYCKLLLSDSNISPLQIEAVGATEIQDRRQIKSQSQRLRAVLYRAHEQHGGKKEDFDKFYETEMERIIDHYKAKLNP